MKNADAAVSCKRSKKNSDDEERRKRKKKSKSNRRRRVRDSSPSSSSSSSSGSDDGRRTRRKRTKRRKRDPKNPNKKNKGKKRTSRKRRYRSISASSSCSTCRSRSISADSSVSRSPSPRAKTRVRSRSRARGRDEDAAERGRSRRRRRIAYDDRRGSRSRSHSCSTCAGSRSSSSISRRADHRGRICSEEKFDEIEQPRRLRSVLAVAEGRVELEVGNDGKDENRDKIIQTYDDFDRYDEEGRMDPYQEYRERNAIDDRDFAKGGELVEMNTNKQIIENAYVGGDLTCKKSDNSGGSEAVDLESQLRQKALENFKKFRRSLSANTRSTSYQEDEASQSHSRNEAEDALKSLDSKFSGSLEQQENIVEEVWPSKPRVRSVVSIPVEEDAPSNSISWQNSSESSGKVNYSLPDSSDKGGSNLDKLKRIEETSNEMPLQNTLLIKDKQKMIIAAEPGSSIVNDAEESSISRQPTTLLPAHDKMVNVSEKKEEDAGSQFQQKTFSRMHDGELVQVSYKVYIPKKTPALARRQLQR